MQRLSALALLPLTLLSASFLCTGCMVFGIPTPKPKKVEEPKESKYDKLAAKAEAGDIEAARELVKWCYKNDADSERAKYWLQVAARNGDKASARLADHLTSWK